MAVLSQIPNGASNKDVRDTINNALVDMKNIQAALAALPK